MRIDCHVHAFAEAIVERAMTALRAELPSDHVSDDGRLDTLVAHLDRLEFDHAIVASIATKPSQFEVIRQWSSSIRNGALGAGAAEKLIPFLSVHPSDPARFKHIEETARGGFKGLKLHPYYQSFSLADGVISEMLQCAADNNLVVLLHTGYDIAFAREPVADPAKLLRLTEKLPDLKLIAAHFGGWDDWEAVAHHLIGAPIALDISMARGFLDPERMHEMLLRHSPDLLLYGSDWPWNGQDADLELLHSFNLPPALMQAIMGDNAARLLALKHEVA